jgi:acetylornithine/succinyldiaminopimelate/putrescine aminotransferase
MHASTFGGNPIAARAGLAAIAMIEEQDLLARARDLGELFRRRLLEMQGRLPVIREVRVVGLMIGVELVVDGAPLVKACMDRKLLINCTHGTVLRLLPAMTLSEQQLHEGCEILADALATCAT